MARSFVVQQHQATTLHYDFRLEVAGVLRSWAVPKGPSMDPAEKRLAVEVEDHSLAHGSFEGRAGKGGVIIWDRGSYEPLDDIGIEAALERGKASFRLDGEKLRGAFTLVRTRGDEKKPQWLLIKQRDDEAGENADRPESVVEREDPRGSLAAPHQAGDGGDELLGALFLEVRGPVDDAVAGVVVHQAERDLVERSLDRRDLGQHVDAVAVLVDHVLDAADLPFHALEALEQLLFGRGVAAFGGGHVQECS